MVDLEHSIIVRINPDTERLVVHLPSCRLIDQFALEFCGLGELAWRRGTSRWSMPATPSVLQRVRRWCDSFAFLAATDWDVLGE